MKYSKIDIEWPTSIQGMSVSDLRDYLSKREGIVNYLMVLLCMGNGKGTRLMFM